MRPEKFILGWRESALFLILFYVLLIFAIPNRSVDSWGLFNFYKIGLLFWALCLIQFLSTLILKKIGPRMGSFIGGFFAGLVSSTALTVSACRLSKSHPELSRMGAISLVAGMTAMLIEGLFICFMISPIIGFSILPAMGAMLALCLFAGFILILKGKSHYEIPQEEKPLDLISMLKLTIVLIAMIAAVGFGKIYFGQSGVTVLTALASMFELHAVLGANLQLFISGSLTQSEVQPLILVGIASASLSKLLIVHFMGSKKMLYLSGFIVGLMPLLGALIYILGL